MRPPAAARYGVAVAAAGAATILRLALDPLWGLKLPFILFYPAIVVSAWLGGFWPGIVATALSALAVDVFWMTPFQTLMLDDPSDFVALVVFVGVGGVISGLNEAWRRGATALARSEERLRVTLGSIGDAVITTDEHGRVTGLNGAAQSLTGWTESEAAGQPFERVLVLVNEDTRKPAENPLARALREGVVSGLANHTLLRSRDGREIPIDDSAAPIKVADGSTVGAIVVFRDVSGRRRSERERAALLEGEHAARVHSERVAHDLRQLQALTDSALASVEPEALARELLARVRSALASDTATILLVDPDGIHVTPLASEGLPAQSGANVRIPLGRGIAGRIAVSDRAMVIDDTSQVETISPLLRDRVASLVGVPLRIGTRLLGVMYAGSSTPRRFTDADAHLLTLAAERVALAIERARLNEGERAARRDAETSAEQLRIALEAGRMGTWQYTMGTDAVKWSPGLEAIHGYAPGSFPGTFEAFRTEIHPDDRDRVLGAIGAAVEQHRDHHIEYRIVRTDGTVRWVEGRGQLFLDQSGQPERMVGVCLDVTERKQAEETFRLAVEAAPAAMIMVDQRGTIVLINALTEQLLGYARHEIVGQSMDRFVPARFRDRHPEYRRSFFADSRRRPMGAGRDLYAMRKDGTEVPVEIGLSPIQTGDGLLVLAAVNDISERKQVEEERAQLLVREQAARADIERASRLKDEFLAVLSHELRTPLNAVLGYTHLLTSGTLAPERVSHALDAIQRNAHAQARLVESLLDLSRVMAGKLELDLEELDLRTIMGAALDVLGPEAGAKGIAFDVVGPTSAVVLEVDGGRLQQVFWNLLSNAVKFTPRDGRVGIRIVQADSEVRIHVSDSGQGIRADFLPHVFDRFKQARQPDRRAPAGLGLGLALVREMVQAHGGTVIAESDGEGRGSTFTVTLPVPAVPAASSTRKATTARSEAVVDSLPHLDILVVDDDGDVRDLLTLLLESRGAIVRTASSADEALEAIVRHRPDVLLADLRMPEKDGYSLIRTLRAHEREHDEAHLPAVAVTADASPSDREKAMAAGYDWHVAKPVEPGDLARAIVQVARAGTV